MPAAMSLRMSCVAKPRATPRTLAPATSAVMLMRNRLNHASAPTTTTSTLMMTCETWLRVSRRCCHREVADGCLVLHRLHLRQSSDR